LPVLVLWDLSGQILALITLVLKALFLSESMR
jgi:hypothetical protein